MKSFLISIISTLSLFRFKIIMGQRLVIGRNVKANFRLIIRGPGKIILKNNVNLWAHQEPTRLQTFSKSAIITLEKDSRINGATLQCREAITIGPKCLLGSAIIMDNDFHHVDPVRRFDPVDVPTKPVVVKNNVWICGQAVVLKGVTIGNNSVVGFRAVVAKDVEPNVVVAGNPAVLVKKLA